MKRKPITVGQLLDELYADPEWVAAKLERDRKLAELEAADRRAEAPLVQDLNEAGVNVRSSWDLVNSKERYPSAVPILLNNLMEPYPERVREGIARALAVPEARIGWDRLLEAFKHEKDDTTVGIKWALALALGAAGTDAELDDVILLLRDARLGRNRAPLLKILGRSRDPRADSLLEELSQDVTLARDVNVILRRRRPRKRAKKTR